MWWNVVNVVNVEMPAPVVARSVPADGTKPSCFCNVPKKFHCDCICPFFRHYSGTPLRICSKCPLMNLISVFGSLTQILHSNRA